MTQNKKKYIHKYYISINKDTCESQKIQSKIKNLHLLQISPLTYALLPIYLLSAS